MLHHLLQFSYERRRQARHLHEAHKVCSTYTLHQRRVPTGTPSQRRSMHTSCFCPQFSQRHRCQNSVSPVPVIFTGVSAQVHKSQSSKLGKHRQQRVLTNRRSCSCSSTLVKEAELEQSKQAQQPPWQDSKWTQYKWTVYRGVAYDLTSFIDRHPAGNWLINLAIGRDCTALFESYHLRPRVAVEQLKRLPVLSKFPVEAVPTSPYPNDSELYNSIR